MIGWDGKGNIEMHLGSLKYTLLWLYESRTC